MLRTALLTILLAVPVWAQTKQLDMQPGGGWIDTGIDLAAGDSLQINATGQMQYVSAKQPNGPEGLARGYMDLLRMMPFNDAGRGTLIGRIGSNDAARPFVVGPQFTSRAPIAGRLFLAVNQSSSDSASGSYHVSIARSASAVAPSAAVAVAAFPQKMIDSIPKRVNDANGTLGDRVNFILIGTQDQVQGALKAAGWVIVDSTKKEAAFNMILDSLSKDSYVSLPMSELNLFGRPQDFGYAQADPLRVVASRHHFRLWKTPYTLAGQLVWAGAGMHDIGFARDDRNNGVTHKIDPNSDGERDFIRDSLAQTGLTVKTDYITPSNPVLNATTATGSPYTSDGRTLLVYFPATAQTAQQ